MNTAAEWDEAGDESELGVKGLETVWAITPSFTIPGICFTTEMVSQEAKESNREVNLDGAKIKKEILTMVSPL